MKTIALLTVIAAWGSVLFLRPEGTGLRVLLMVVFLLLGTLFTLAGGFAYWWDGGMRPDKASPTVLICGLLTLASQAGSLLRAVFEGEGGTEWPGRR
ncbi:hypothetical protein [Hydrogenophaga sp.]|uniref:hypothetical protein n=1 Tax=Hydrogenophaga sp. TaxID=1904254 RepID=UPI002618E618|nr:hypothetical protein [Hydrogenophaga sp.]MCW5655476.1 hypothetical protein [Hydrogenophaga sp.]